MALNKSPAMAPIKNHFFTFSLPSIDDDALTHSGTLYSASAPGFAPPSGFVVFRAQRLTVIAHVATDSTNTPAGLCLPSPSSHCLAVFTFLNQHRLSN
uniref:Uncharacterized protein n=1 Tax=Panagrellus redivivus TaxID=6233 RepID=A0A7E4WBF0_PANRE